MFSASNADEADPYAFEIDLTKSKSSSKKSSSTYKRPTYENTSDSSDDDNAKTKKRSSSSSHSRKKSPAPVVKKEVVKTTGTALDRASVYLSKYKKAPDVVVKEDAPKLKVPSTVKDDFDDFMNESEDESPSSSRRNTKKGKHHITVTAKPAPAVTPAPIPAPAPALAPTQLRQRTSSFTSSPKHSAPKEKELTDEEWNDMSTSLVDSEISSMFGLPKSSSSPAKKNTQGGDGGYSLGNTLKKKFSSSPGDYGVVKSGSDIKDIYQSSASASHSSDDELNETVAEEEANGDEGRMEEEQMDASPSPKSSRGKVMGFDMLDTVVALAVDVDVGEEGGRKSSDLNLNRSPKGVSFAANEKVSPNKWRGGGDSSFGSGSYDNENDFEESLGESMGEDYNGKDDDDNDVGNDEDKNKNSSEVLSLSPKKEESAGRVMSFDMLAAVAIDSDEEEEEKEQQREIAPSQPPKAASASVSASATVAATASTTPIKYITPTITTSTTSSTKPKMVSISTQCYGNHAGVQADLAPRSMYGTSSSLDVRYTVEMSSYFGDGGEDYYEKQKRAPTSASASASASTSESTSASTSEMLLPPPPPPQSTATTDRTTDTNKSIYPSRDIAIASTADVYLQLLNQARQETIDAKADLDRIVMATNLRMKAKDKEMKASLIRTVRKKKHKDESVNKENKENIESNNESKTSDAELGLEGNNSSFDLYKTSSTTSSPGSLSLSASLGANDMSKNAFNSTAVSSLFGTKLTLGTETGRSVEIGDVTVNETGDGSGIGNGNDTNHSTASLSSSSSSVSVSAVYNRTSTRSHRNDAYNFHNCNNSGSGRGSGVNYTNPTATMSMTSIQALFKRQLDGVKRGIVQSNLRQFGYGSVEVKVGGKGEERVGGNERERGSSRKEKDLNKEAKKKRNKSKSRSESESKTRSKSSMSTSSAAATKQRPLQFWEALMRVDLTLTKKEAKKIAKKSDY